MVFFSYQYYYFQEHHFPRGFYSFVNHYPQAMKSSYFKDLWENDGMNEGLLATYQRRIEQHKTNLRLDLGRM